MKKLSKFFKSEKGASIIETLVAMGFIGVVSTSFLSLAITARKLSFKHRVQNELGQYAGMVTEEMLKDYTINGSVNATLSSFYCNASSQVESAILVAKFLADYSGSCAIVKDSAKEEYTVTLTGEAFGRPISAERILKLE